MNRLFFYIILMSVLPVSVNAQNYYTKNGSISFLSKTSLENIKADNNQVMAVLNTQTGEMQFSLLVKSFHFEKALMEEHFNENYLESDKFPKSTFKGIITDMSRISFNTNGMYKVTVAGELLIHGVSNKIISIGTITINDTKISASAVFIIRLSDYKVNIPKLLKDNIAQTVEVTMNSVFDRQLQVLR